MVTKVKIQNGKLVDLESDNIYTDEIPGKEFFVANRWVGQKKENGTIVFSSMNKKDSSKIWCTIGADGVLSAYRKRSTSRPYKFLTKKIADNISSVTGTMILGGGYTLDRTVRFFKDYKKDILKDHGITKFKREDSNRLFPVNLNSSDKYKSFVILTDGTKEYILFNDIPYVLVKDSTFSIVCEYNKIESEVTLYSNYGQYILEYKLPYIELDIGMFFVKYKEDINEECTLVQQA